MLDDLLPEHLEGAPLIAILFVTLGVVLLLGSVWFLLSTNIGAKRGFQITVFAVLGYLFLNAITWIVSGNGPVAWPVSFMPEVSTGSDYFDRRVVGGTLGLLALVLLALGLWWMHTSEREQQRIPED